MGQKLLISLFSVAALNAAPEIVLPNGPIRGREGKTFKNTPYYAFQKIPYASPPLGELRFKAPQPPENWNEPLDTFDMDVVCYQVTENYDKESEDCLYLNVFTPQLPSNNIELLPVVFFIHGGGFISGSGKMYSDPIIDANIVYISINYRLGPFGFLSTQDEIIPGNNGLKDQQLALKWAHDNVHLFGGDPNKVTIYGHSGGSASCTYQLLNHQNKGMFRGAILQSGTFLDPWAFQRRARDIAFDTAAFLNDTFKNNRDSKALLQFLQGADAKAIDQASEQYSNSEESPKDPQLLQGIYWAPVLEVKNSDGFVTKKMYGLLKTGKVIAVPSLIGMTSEEMIAFYPNADELKNTLAAYDKHLSWLVPNDMEVTDQSSRTDIGQKIRDIYTGGKPLSDNLGNGIRYFTDTAFARPIIKYAELYSSNAETYFYQFSYKGEIGQSDTHYEGAESVGHGEDLRYIFCSGKSCDVSGYPQQDQITVERMTTMWTNFVKYLNPIPETCDLLQNITWPKVSHKTGDFFYVNINKNLKVRDGPKKEVYDKWIEIYNSLNYTDFDTF